MAVLTRLLLTAVLAAEAGARSDVFEPNLGQWPEHVLFHGRAGALQTWLDADGWTLALFDPQAQHAARDEQRAWCLRLEWEHAPKRLGPREPLDATCSAFIGADPARWRGAALLHRQAAFEELAPGVSLIARSTLRGPEFDLEVAPQADPTALVLSWSGHCALELDEHGALRVLTGLGALELPRPIALAHHTHGAEWIECEYRILDERRFCIAPLRRPEGSALWIDPALHWGTYLGGQSQQSIAALELLPSGAVVVAGVTDSIDYPTSVGAFQPHPAGGTDAFVSVLAADGRSLLHSTLLAGSADDRIVALGLAPGGAIVVGGDTLSADFPTTPGAHDRTLGGSADAFVARLSPDLSTLEWSTFAGGASVEIAGDLAVRPSGAALLVGATRGAGFPATSGAYDASYNGGSFAGDAFALELSFDGSAVVWGTFLGGAGEELAQRLALGPGGELTLSGTTYGASFPTTPGAFDRVFDGFEEPFVARLNAQGSALLFSTFVGRAGEDALNALLVRADGATYLGGRTDDPHWPLGAGAHDASFKGPAEGWLALLSATGDALAHSTFLGGGADDAVTALAFDSAGYVVVGLQTLSEDLATSPGAFDRHFASSLGGNEIDAYVARFKPDLSSFDYATYFGGRNPERLSALRVDPQRALVLAGTTNGPDLPTTAGAWQPAWNITALSEGFVARLELLLHPIEYGLGKLNSGGSRAQVLWTGFPSVADQNFFVGVDFAMPNAWCTVFSGLAPADQPLCGGRLRVGAPFTRYPRFKSDFFGYGKRAVPLAPWMAGQTLYFQVWYVDDQDPFGCALSDALAVLVHP